MKKTLSILLICIIVFSSIPAAVSAEETPEVPAIRVTTADGNGNSLQKEDGYVDADISITDTDGSVLSDAVSFKVRGNSTALPGIPKKAFTFKFAKKKEVLSIGKGKKWVLLANTYDPTLMRNYIAFDLAHKLGLPYTADYKIVELWVDDVFKGCYLLSEPVQEGTGRVEIDIESNDGKKDFMLELEAQRDESDVKYIKKENIRFAISEPEEPDDEQVGYIGDTMQGIFDILKTGDKEQIESVLDLDSFVKFYIFNDFVKTLDLNYSSVYFFYKDGKLYAGPPWDYDLAFGNTNKENSYLGSQANKPTGTYALKKNIFAFLTKLSWFNELARGCMSENFELFADITREGGEIDTFLADYQNVIHRNYKNTGLNPGRFYITVMMRPYATYDENLDFLRDWCEKRRMWMADYYGVDLPNGDINLDLSVNIKDATLLQKFLADIVTLNSQNKGVSDVNKDGKINISDATAIQKSIANLN